jgi:chorismate--pyruvate lyase
LLGWLTERGSLTARLRACCGAGFAVRVLAERWMRIPAREARVLGIAPTARCLVREVQLLCDDTPWVYARSVLPAQALTGPWRRLRRLGAKPLGAVLFADTRIERAAFEFAALKPAQRGDPRALRAPGPQDSILWGRRCIYRCGRRRLLVSEFFLPTLTGRA